MLTLALGVAANTTVFSWVRSVLLQPIPGAAGTGRLRVVYSRTPSGEPALGASPRQLLGSFLAASAHTAAVGMAVGLAGAASVARLTASQLPGVAPLDPLALAAATLLIAVIAAAASYFPARRASQVDPMEALKNDR